MDRSGTAQTWPQKERGLRKLISIKVLKARVCGLFYYSTMKKLTALIALASLTLAHSSCKKENGGGKLNPTCDGSHPTYQGEIKTILDTKCGSSNCHPNYTNYDGLRGILDGGDFRREVLVEQTMPKGTSLTQSQINLIQCWANDGFPEN